MDQERFDRLTRSLASSQSRRGLLKGLTGTALGGMLAAAGLRGTALAVPAGKTTICHWDAPRATYQQLSVPARELKGHARHTRDIIAPNFDSPQTCGSCNITCTTTVAHATATCSAGSCRFACNEGYESDGNGGCQLVQTCVPDGGACSYYESSGACCSQNCCASYGLYCPPGIDPCCCTVN